MTRELDAGPMKGQEVMMNISRHYIAYSNGKVALCHGLIDSWCLVQMTQTIARRG